MRQGRTPPDSDPRGRLRIRALGAAALLAASALLLLIVEGGASFVVLVHEIMSSDAEATYPGNHLQYDPDLGWASVPGAYLPDVYGPGQDVRIDGAGFRCTTGDCSSNSAADLRIICAGDSFAFGYGVGDVEAWCSLLAAGLPGADAVNMGQAGYGIDQAYLWYSRDGTALEHELLLFTFIDEDFRRMASRRFLGAPKPVLRVDSAGLVVDNVPVPRTGSRGQGLQRAAAAVSELRIVTLFRRSGLGATPGVEAIQPVEVLSAQVFSDLARVTRQQGVRLVLVYLPTRVDYFRTADELGLRDHAHAVADSIDATFVDLASALQRLHREEMEGLFIAPGESRQSSAVGHYNRRGNAWAAMELRRQLSDLPEIGSLIGASASERR